MKVHHIQSGLLCSFLEILYVQLRMTCNDLTGKTVPIWKLYENTWHKYTYISRHNLINNIVSGKLKDKDRGEDPQYDIQITWWRNIGPTDPQSRRLGEMKTDS